MDKVRREVESLHEFFCVWFGGRIPQEEFEQQFLPRFHQDLAFIPPAGELLNLEDISAWIRGGYGSNPDFRIQIRNVTIHREFEGHVLATYEEWQRNALASEPSDNGRIASVVFVKGERLKWLHIHETWVPREIMEADLFDF
jgi:hypothetical protein